MPLRVWPDKLFARRLVVPRTHAGPRGEVASGWEERHGCADCRNQHFRHACATPWNGVEEVNGWGEKRVGASLKLSLNFRGRAGHRLVSWVVWASQFLEEETVGRGQVAGQGLLELSHLGLQLTLGQLSECRGLLFPVGERLEP